LNANTIGGGLPDEVIRETEEFAREVLEERERNAQLPWDEDPLFKNVSVYDGPVPSDLSERHDDYLYGPLIR
jgi:hypothetical protein